MKYKRKPTEVDAVLWDGSEKAQDEIKELVGGPVLKDSSGRLAAAGASIPFGVWVVRKADGRLDLLQPNKFEERYEPVV
jgi:hypothetical protein